MKIEWILDEELKDNILQKMEDAASACPPCEGITVPCSITVRLCSDEEIAKINADCRNISFLGDIIISVPHLYAQAEEYGHSVEREATYLLVHGMCHLMGYDHMADDEKKAMRSMEEKILSSVC